jgi:hypothetical protein
MNDLCSWLFLCISRVYGVLVKEWVIFVCGYFSVLVGFRVWWKNELSLFVAIFLCVGF